MWKRPVTLRFAAVSTATVGALLLGASRQCRQEPSSRDDPPKTYDAIVIGGGLVGLSIARTLALLHQSVALIEAAPQPAASPASSGNSGIGCTGYDAPSGSLERRLLRRSIELHPTLYRSFGLSYDHVRKSGSLVVAWSDEEKGKLRDVLEENIEARDTEAHIVSEADLRELEPCLSERAKGAVLCPREAVVEPFLVGIGYTQSCLLHGVDLLINTSVDGAERGADGVWSVQCSQGAQRDLANWQGDGRSRDGALLAALDESVTSTDNRLVVRGNVVVNAAGLFGDVVESFRLASRKARDAASGAVAPPSTEEEPVPFNVKPRKGQCLVIKPTARSPPPPEHVLEQIATQFTKGIIVWTTVYGNIVIGPTADEVPSRSDRTTDLETVESLAARGARILGMKGSDAPGAGLQTLRDNGYEIVGTHSGIRVATEHRDYQIRAIAEDGWITVGGIRSTGLTASPGIGEYVGELYRRMLVVGTDAGAGGAADGDDGAEVGRAEQEDGGEDNGPRGVHTMVGGEGSSKLFDALGEGPVSESTLAGVTHCATTNGGPSTLEYPPTPARVPNGRVPALAVLAAEYKRRGDGKVTVWGKEWVVTHPLASFGMETYDGEHTTS